MNANKILLSISTVFVLSACGGGGGGGGGASATLAPFTSWSAVAPNTRIVVDGISQSGTYSGNLGTNRITALTAGSSQSGATYAATYDGAGFASEVTITPAGGAAVSWSRPTDTFGQLVINNNVDVAISADGSRAALAANPFDLGWNYQSFGIWSTGGGTGSGTYGAISVGAATTGTSIPASGVATYTGATGGRFVASDGRYFFTSSSMTAAANFTTRSINFSTSNTTLTPDLLAITSANFTPLNLTGTLSYAANTNQITGSVSAAGGTASGITVNAITGSVNGRFYGPSAQEIGGTFGLTGAGVEGYAGAFGGKRL